MTHHALGNTAITAKLSDIRLDTVPALLASLTPANGATVNVKDENDSPLPGVTVLIFGSALETTTDAAGAFYFENPPTGDQAIQISEAPPPLIDPQRIGWF